MATPWRKLSEGWIPCVPAGRGYITPVGVHCLQGWTRIPGIGISGLGPKKGSPASCSQSEHQGGPAIKTKPGDCLWYKPEAPRGPKASRSTLPRQELPVFGRSGAKRSDRLEDAKTRQGPKSRQLVRVFVCGQMLHQVCHGEADERSLPSW